MRLNDTKIFLDKDKLYQLVNLRRSGWGLTSLALYFNCDISSIRHQCDKYEITPLQTVVTFEHLIKPIMRKYEIKHEQERLGINRGKSYREYLIAAGLDPKNAHIYTPRF